MSSHFLGWVGLIFPIVVSIFIISRHREIGLVIFVSLFVRVVSALTHFYIVPLPDGISDARAFEIKAWLWSQSGFLGAFESFPGIYDSNFLVWIMALVYSVTDRSLLLLQSISVLSGVLCVYVTWLLTKKLWGRKIATKAAWFIALFPTVVMYSALTMRETYAMLFFLIGLSGALSFVHNRRLFGMLLAAFGFFSSALFHGGMIVAFFVFLGIMSLIISRRTLYLLNRGKISFTYLLIIITTVGLFTGFILKDFSLPKLGTFEQMVDTEYLLTILANRVHGDAAFPEWLQPHSLTTLLLLAPIRAIYFLFSPFPWDVEKISHIFGFFDGFLYFILVFLIWRVRKLIWKDPRKKTLLLIAGALVLVYSFGTGNFGSGVRHRSKLLPSLIILAAPKIPRPRLKFRDVQRIKQKSKYITSNFKRNFSMGI